MRRHGIALASGAAAFFAACCRSAQLTVEEGMGPAPALPKPSTSLLPTIKVAEAVGWKNGVMPKAGNGLAVAAFATGLDHPRWLHVLPNGDVLVAETNAPRRPLDGGGIRGFFFKKYQKKAGGDRKSTRLNSSHLVISYAVFCLK